ncbi:Arf-GAP with Rho-GAP domain, ANK repeat and PH domain-containing protein 2 [Microtus ochrogaster]|uniref:Arf-GAP with Rho-GAP domain, ANK repeat and PH domain-containing protein 2 n=1 Tax=Microtus ochrogaster TaxID=79684 RepID=A0A8J6G8S0_MICOH|nr:Arf-GAP with Rho-GAP domain, ANK repeat and PH domain-containing protein 2 [Microtus ochrogaster]
MNVANVKQVDRAVKQSFEIITPYRSFSGADVMCATGDPVHSTPYLLAKKAGQSLQMEFLYHNKFSDFPQHDVHSEGGSSQEAAQSTFLCDFLYQAPAAASRVSTEKKLLEETNKKWCVLEGGFLSYYENDKSTAPNGTINISEVICLVVHKEDFYLNTGTLYIHGHTKLDFTVWHTAIEKAAGTDGNALQDQQLCKNDVPIIVNSCIAFVTQYGLGCKNIYQKNGDPSHISELLESFKKDARSVKLRVGKHQLEDVTSVLKNFLSDIDDALLTKELYPYWVSQAGDLLIEVYVERKEPDCSIIIRISPVMEAEELTNDILAIKNIVPTKGDIWATFEVIENEELERPLHYTENVLEQVLQWSSLAEPGSAYLVVKKFLTIDTIKHCREKSIKEGALKLKEEPSKILSGNKFQDRYIVLRDGHLFIYKDPKSSKHDKMFSLSLMKFYLGVKKKMKPPTRHLCCDSLQAQMEWMASIFIAQHENDIWPPAGKERKRSITKNPKIGGLPLIPIQHERNASQAQKNIESARAELERLRLCEKHDRDFVDPSLKDRASIIAHCLEHKDDKLRNRARKHRSFNCLEDTEAEIPHSLPKGYKGPKTPKKTEDRNSKTTLDHDHKLPSKVIEELSVVLQRSRTLPKELQDEQTLQK